MKQMSNDIKQSSIQKCTKLGAQNLNSQRYRWLVLLVAMLSFLPIVLDFTILHIAIPSLTLALHASGTEVLWIIDIYPLLMASLLLPMGTLADKIGYRKLLLLGLSIFTLGSIFAAFSPSAGILIGSRAFIGVGSAMVMPCILAIIRQAFDDEKERALALGIWGTVGSAGAALGPLAGGILLEHFWWGSVFLINVPVMMVVIPLVMIFAPRQQQTGTGNWTIGQALVLIIAIMGLVYAIKSGIKTNSNIVEISLIVCSCIAMLVWFVRKQLHSTTPMPDMTLFSKPAITTGVIMALTVMGSLAGVELMLAQELQFILNYTPLQAGMFMLPLMIASAIGGPLGGLLLGRIGLQLVASFSLLIAAGSLAGLAYSSFEQISITVLVLMSALGLSLSIGLTASSVAIMSSTSKEQAGSAGALESTSYDLGSGLGITIFGLLLTTNYQKSIQLPTGMSTEMATTAGQSIGETLTVARSVGGSLEHELIVAGQQAFSSSHSIVLLTAATVIGILSIVVFLILRKSST